MEAKKTMKIDLNFKRQVLDLMIGGEDISLCYQCGYCNTVCPVHQRVGSRYNPRDLVLFSLLGYKDAIINHADPMGLWGCTACETCDVACPSKIPITDIIALLKNISVAQGKCPPYYPTQTQTIFDNGKAIPVQDAIEKRREKLGLAPAPTIHAEEIKTLMEACGIASLLEKAAPSGEQGGN
jgi:heterodisulfide reductase subunit C